MRRKITVISFILAVLAVVHVDREESHHIKNGMEAKLIVENKGKGDTKESY